MRQIQQFFRALAKILSRQGDTQQEAALALIDHALKGSFGLTAEQAGRLSTSQLLNMLELQGGEEADLRMKCAFFAAVLKEQARVCAASDSEEQAFDFLVKALELRLRAGPEEEDQEWLEFAPSVEELVEATSDYELPAETKAALLQYYEEAGAFASAEDVLLDWVDDGSEDRALLEFALAFYERLSALSDEQLCAGGLPRDEVEAGEAALRERLQSGSSESTL